MDLLPHRLKVLSVDTMGGDVRPETLRNSFVLVKGAKIANRRIKKSNSSNNENDKRQ